MNSEDVTFAILAGGRGSRLGGCAKGLLEVGGQTLLSLQLRSAAAFKNRVLVADDAVPYLGFDLDVVRDVEPGCGAPGGVVSALLAARTAWVLVVACDMPFVNDAMFTRLMTLDPHAHDVACFTRAGHFEPLCALYRQTLGSLWRPRLGEERSLRALLASVRVHCEPVSDDGLLDSVNTPADLVRHGAMRKF